MPPDSPDAPNDPNTPRRPPSPEALDMISREQGMITDEWTGDAPGAPDTTAGTAAPTPAKRDEEPVPDAPDP